MSDPQEKTSRLEDLFGQCLEASPIEVDTILGRPDISAAVAREVRELLAVANDTSPDQALSIARPPAGPTGSSTLSGRVVGGCRILSVIQTGGMGTVHLAEDLKLHRQVAVKTIRTTGRTTELLDRFRSEAAVLARLQHPNIATIHGADLERIDDEDVPWISMELIEDARSIDVAMKEDAADRGRILATFQKVLDAVHHAHVRGIIHRDLKPSNILIDANGQPKLIDFGIARILDGEARSHETADGDVLGTPRYMSPEQCRGESHAADTRSDIFSAGVVLYELILHRHPFDLAGKSPLEAMQTIAKGTATPPRDVSTAVSHDLAAVLEKSIAADPELRYQSAADFAEDLRCVLDREPVAARQISLLRLTRSRARKHPIIVGMLATLLFAIIAGVIYGSIMTNRVYREALRGQRYIDTLLLILQHESIKGRGAEATVADALTAMSAMAFELDQPEDQDKRADIQLVLAHGWSHLGLHEKALAAAQDAVDLRSALVSGETPDTMEARLVLLQMGLARTMESNTGAPGDGGDESDLFMDLVAKHQDALGADHPQTRAAAVALVRTLASRLPEQESFARQLRETFGDDVGVQIAYSGLSSAWDEFEAAGDDVQNTLLLSLIDRTESAERVASGVRPEPLLSLMRLQIHLMARPQLRDSPAHLQRLVDATDRLDAICEDARRWPMPLERRYLLDSPWKVENFQSFAIEKRLAALLELERLEELLATWEARRSEILPGEDRAWSGRWASFAAARLNRNDLERSILLDVIEHARLADPPLQSLIDACNERLATIDSEKTSE